MTKPLIVVFIMGLFSFLLGCQNNNKKVNESDTIKLEEITADTLSPEDWADISLKIMSDTPTDTSHIYIAKGLYKNKSVGLKIIVSSNIDAGIINGKIDGKTGFAKNAIQLQSIGKESDDFIKALAILYHQSPPKAFAKNIISATVFSLNEKAVDIKKEDRYKLKLFFEEDSEDLYSEIFLNIDIHLKKIDLNEKDMDYRA